jgi:two-component system sensor histidine kinase QseC
VRNLLDNAVRYSPRGSQVDITLNAREFSVRDNGPGVSPQALARIGERFYRPPGQDEPGSGLGLSIVRRIAALHG